jgi:hypothetical protein
LINIKRKGFISPLPSLSGTKNTSSVPKMNLEAVGRGVSKAYDVYKGMPQPAQTIITAGAQQIMDNANRRKRDYRGGSGSSKRRKPNSQGGDTSYALSKAQNPTPIELNTGIKPNFYTSDYSDAEVDTCSPMHMSSALIAFPDYTESVLYDYFENIVAFDIQTAAQANVGFNLNVSTQFTGAQILTAMNNLLYGLQVYFYYNSIIAYHSDPSNQNVGMVYIRNNITSSMLEDYYLLERKLRNMPIPPNLLKFVRYMAGNYHSGNTLGSPIIKISPLILSASGVNNTALINSRTNLETSANNTVFTLMRRAVPQWVPGDLGDIPPKAQYDANFNTIFSNLPFRLYDGTNHPVYPNVSTNDEEIEYNVWTEDLDGAAFAMCSVYNSAQDAILPGLIQLVGNSGGTNGATRRSYYEDAGLIQFYRTELYPFLVRSRAETYYVDDFTTFNVTHCHLFGTNRALSVSQETIRETCFKVIDHLMSLDTIRTESKRRGGR